MQVVNVQVLSLSSMAEIKLKCSQYKIRHSETNVFLLFTKSLSALNLVVNNVSFLVRLK